MSWRKIGRKFFKDKRHIGISLYPTNQCDTGCIHCFDNSDCRNPIHFTKEHAEQIIREARRERWMLSICLTGGGEPLQNPNFLDIADTFNSYERLGLLTVVTSGFLDAELQRKVHLKNLLSRPYAEKIRLEQSFNLYHDTFPQRLRNTIIALLQIRKKAYFNVKACMSLENFVRTQRGIECVIGDVSKEIGANYFSLPLGWEERDRRLFHYFDDTVIGDMRAWKMHVESFLIPQFHAIKTEEGGLAIRVEPISFEKTGRGRGIDHTPFGHSICDAVTRCFEHTILIVGPDGSVYPDCSCYPTEHMSLGKIGETPLVELVHRKDLFAERLMRAMLLNSRICEWGTDKACNLCKEIVAEKGLELKQ